MSYIALAFGLGVAVGLRSLSPPAVVAWAAHLGWLNLSDSPLRFMASTIAVVIFSLLAVFELIADLRPSTPKRTAPMPLIARILMGGLCGTCVYWVGSNQGWILGAVGGVIGAFAGYEIRPFGRRVACQRHFCRFARRLGRDRTRLFLRFTLTPAASRATECDRGAVSQRFSVAESGRSNGSLQNLDLTPSSFPRCGNTW